MSLWKALSDGITAATRIPAPLVVLFVVNLVVALVLTVPVYAALDSWVGHRLAARDLAHDFDGVLMLEPLLSRVSEAQTGAPSPDSQAAATSLTAMLGMTLVAWLLAPLPNATLGGVLLTYADGRFTWRRFLWGAWHWLLPFVVLLLLFAGCALFVIALGIAAGIAVQAAHASVLTTPVLVATALVHLALAMTFEYARVIAVADGTRNIFRTLGRAIVFIAHQPVRTFGLYVLMGAVGVALIPLYSGIVAPLIPFTWGLAAIAAQQLYIVGRWWARLARWASEIALYRQEDKVVE